MNADNIALLTELERFIKQTAAINITPLTGRKGS